MMFPATACRGPERAQRSGSDGERTSSEVNDVSPKAERNDTQLARTKEQGISRMLTINLNDVERELTLR